MTRARTRSRDAEPSRERILVTAAHLFARYGSVGMSLQMLAGEVGLHKSPLFHYFSGKEELLHLMLQEELGRILAVLEPLAVDDPPSLDRLIAVAHALVDHFAHASEAGLILLRSLVSPELDEDTIPEGFESVERRIFVIIGAWLDRARRAGAIGNVRVRHALVNLLGLFLFYPAVADDELGREILDGDPGSPRALRARKEELAACRTFSRTG